MHNRKLNVLDCMLEKMEQYSNNLEQVIAQRTTELMEEKEASYVTSRAHAEELIGENDLTQLTSRQTVVV